MTTVNPSNRGGVPHGSDNATAKGNRVVGGIPNAGRMNIFAADPIENGITRSEALKAAGNGVVWQQAAEALRYLIAMPKGREIADAYAPMDLLELAASEDGAA